MLRGENVLREVGKFAEKQYFPCTSCQFALVFLFFFFFWFLKNIYLFIWLCQVLIANVGSFLVVVCELLVVTCGI